LKNQNYEYGQLNVKIYIVFCGDNSWTIALRQTKCFTVKAHGHTYKFYLNRYFLWWSFWMWRWFKMLRLTNTEPLCLEVCNFVQCQPFVNCLVI
jgi:hypothetical protein